MKLYTTYFAKCKKLPSSIVPVAICRYPPSGWSGPCFAALAPKYEVFKEYKQSYNWERFAEQYCRTTLSTLNPQEVVSYLETVGQGKDVALVCFEKSPAVCHRSIVAEWLKYNHIPIEEWKC